MAALWEYGRIPRVWVGGIDCYLKATCFDIWKDNVLLDRFAVDAMMLSVA